MSDIKTLLETVSRLSDESTDSPQVLDSFDIELGEHFVIETGIVGFSDDGIIVEADEKTLEFLSLHDMIVESEEYEELSENCWKGYHKEGNKELFGKTVPNCVKNESEMDEAKYQGREVPLGKPMAGDVKKSKVYVRKPNGKVVKVNFGDKNMRIKKNSPGHRKSFRARHHCENPGPRWKARYWSCRAW
jgi:hypothetical protein